MKAASEKKKKQFTHYLNEDEEMLFFTTVSPLYLLNRFILHFCLSLIGFSLVGVGIYFSLKTDPFWLILFSLLSAFLYALQRYYFTREGIQYILTNKRLIVQIGFFHTTMHSTNYNKITHIEVDQTLVERIFYKYGKIKVKTAGASIKPIILNHIGDPLEFRSALDKLIMTERKQFGHFGI